MHRMTRTGLAAVLPVLLATGCDDFLTGPRFDQDPNRPSVATRDQLFAGVQASQFTLQTGHVARIGSMWTQQMAGTDRQYATLDGYNQTEGDFSTQFSRLYTGGGLVDMRRIQETAAADNDRIYAGVAKVWEAFSIGMAASFWGDIPYSQALEEEVIAELDPQSAVYDAVQALLDEAIADLQSGQGPGPGPVDLIYGGNTARWIELAHTLKARFYLHWAEVDPANFDRALAEARQGISSPANDFTTIHTSTSTEQNMWYQFFRDRDTYMRAGRFMVNLLQQRNDPRLALYFSPNQQGEFVGAAPAEAVQSEHSLLSATRAAPGFDQPMVTWAETQLIIAEAAFQTGDAGAARSALNAVRADLGLPAIGGGVTGQPLLEAIMIEKYISLFQNPEAWNDYKRTCLPQLTPAAGRTALPGRLLYGVDERNANPNIPPPSAQPARNANDPNPC